MSDDYKVGRGKPPKDTQFKPGQSGNPNGRPKGSQNLGQAIKKAFKKKVEVTQGGKKKRVTLKDAFAMRLVQSAIHGKVGDQIRVLQAIDKYAPSLLEVEPEGPEEINIHVIDPDGLDREMNLSDWERGLIRKMIEGLRSGEINKTELISVVRNDPFYECD